MKQDQFLTFLVNFCKKNIAKLLIICGIFLAFSPTILNAQYVYGNGAKLSKISPLMSAVATNDLEGVEFFSKAGRGVLDQKNIGGATALHIAARNQNLKIVQTLIKCGANVNISDNDGWTALMRAASVGNSQIVSELLISGADANKKNSVKETAIIHSANSSCSGCMESVLNYIDYKKVNKDYLDDQLEEAFIIANNKSDSETKKILNKFRTKISAGDYPKLFNKDKDGLDLMKLKKSKNNSKKYSLGSNLDSKKPTEMDKTPENQEKSNKNNKFLLKKKQKPLKKIRFKRRKVNPEDLKQIKQPESELKKEIEKETKVIRRKNYLFIKGKRWSENKKLMKKSPKFTPKPKPKKQKTIKFIRKNVIEDVKKEPEINIKEKPILEEKEYNNYEQNFDELPQSSKEPKKIMYKRKVIQDKRNKIVEEKPKKRIIYKRSEFNRPKIVTQVDQELDLPNNDNIEIEEEITQEIIQEKEITGDDKGKSFSFYKMKQKDNIKYQENQLPSFFKLKEQAKADNEVDALSQSDDDVIYFMQEE